jgi:hypothetical protein
MISEGINLEGIHHKENQWLPCIIFFWVIVLLVIALDIKLWIAEHMEEMFRKEMPMRPTTILNACFAD